MHLVIKSHFIFINQTKVYTHKTCRWSNCLICLKFYSSPKTCWIRRSRIRLPWLLSLCCPSCWPSSPSFSSISKSSVGRGILLSMHLLFKPAVANTTFKFLIGDKVLGLCKDNGTSSSIYHMFFLLLNE
jgi:hypothetical protein